MVRNRRQKQNDGIFRNTLNTKIEFIYETLKYITEIACQILLNRVQQEIYLVNQDRISS